MKLSGPPGVELGEPQERIMSLEKRRSSRSRRTLHAASVNLAIAVALTLAAGMAMAIVFG